MAVAIYVTGISTPDVHPEFPPLLGTLTQGGVVSSPFSAYQNHLRGSLGTYDTVERLLHSYLEKKPIDPFPDG